MLGFNNIGSYGQMGELTSFASKKKKDNDKKVKNKKAKHKDKELKNKKLKQKKHKNFKKTQVADAVEAQQLAVTNGPFKVGMSADVPAKSPPVVDLAAQAADFRDNLLGHLNDGELSPTTVAQMRAALAKKGYSIF